LPQALFNRKTRSAAVLLTVLAWQAPVGVAATIGGSISASNDYVLRGVSQTDNHPVAQADLHFAPRDAWTIGAWASPVRLLPGQQSLELNFYTNWRVPLGTAASGTLGATYYSFPNDPRAVPYNYLELNAGLDWRDRILLSAYYAPSVTLFSLNYGRATHRQTWSAELAFSHPLAQTLMAQVGIGYYDAIGLQSAGYSYGSASLARDFGRIHAELSTIWVAAAAQRSYSPGRAGKPLNATISWQF
jgi:uncharacterized protein (TIGR02001 family)